MNNSFDTSIECAKKLDSEDKLAIYRSKFEIPTNDNGEEEIYFGGSYNHYRDTGPLSTDEIDFLDGYINTCLG